MDEESRQQALRTLEELVLDAGEVVSYRRLASVHCLHVNHCKALIQQFVDTHDASHKLNVSVLVCGSTCSGARAVVCPRAELENVRASLNPLLFEHIYAVGRASCALDAATLATAAGGFEDFTQTIGAICSESCSKRSPEEINTLKVKSYNTINNVALKAATPESRNKQPSSSEVKTKELNGAKSKAVTDATKTTVSESKSSEKSSESSSVKIESEVTLKGKPKGGISSFFNRSNGQKATKHSIKGNEGTDEEVKIKIDEKLVTKEISNVKKIEIEQKQIKTKEVSNAKKDKSDNLIVKKDSKKNIKLDVKKETPKKKHVVAISKNNKVDKKRKRVLQISDSEDSDKEDPFQEEKLPEVDIESDEDVIPPTPNADVVKITSAILNPKKRRKIIDRTFTTEDGYMVTKKEEVLESCSEEEGETKENILEINVKKEIVAEKKIPAVTPKSKKKLASPQKGKQASIMSFFSKKP